MNHDPLYYKIVLLIKFSQKAIYTFYQVLSKLVYTRDAGNVKLYSIIVIDALISGTQTNIRSGLQAQTAAGNCGLQLCLNVTHFLWIKQEREWALEVW